MAKTTTLPVPAPAEEQQAPAPAIDKAPERQRFTVQVIGEPATTGDNSNE